MHPLKLSQKLSLLTSLLNFLSVLYIGSYGFPYSYSSLYSKPPSHKCYAIIKVTVFFGRLFHDILKKNPLLAITSLLLFQFYFIQAFFRYEVSLYLGLENHFLTLVFLSNMQMSSLYKSNVVFFTKSLTFFHSFFNGRFPPC